MSKGWNKYTCLTNLMTGYLNAPNIMDHLFWIALILLSLNLLIINVDEKLSCIILSNLMITVHAYIVCI